MLRIGHCGFKLETASDASHIKLEMPNVLANIFFASLYLRSNENDLAMGDPEVLWQSMSRKHGNCKLVAPHQIHGTNIVDAAPDYALPSRPEADGVFINEGAECLASLRFADCTPVVIAGDTPKPWMFILHSGFVGTVKNISLYAFHYLEKIYGAQKTGNVWAWILPGISFGCYYRKLSDEKTKEARMAFTDDNMLVNGDRVYFDIHGQIRYQLDKLGVPQKNIYSYDDCTCCNRSLYYSYRAGDKDGRMFLLAGNIATNMKVRVKI